MRVEQTGIDGLVVLVPRRFGDARGFFSESWNRRVMAGHGLDHDFVQDNHSLSREAGTARGLHFQAPPHAQAKLVRCGHGRLFDVAVDIRKGSRTFGRWVGVELSFENGKQLLIPEGFLHGFVTREPETEGAVRFDDPEIGIDWGLEGAAILSDKDAAAPYLRDLDSPFVWEATP